MKSVINYIVIVAILTLSCCGLLMGELPHWYTEFADIDLNITKQGSVVNGNSTATLYIDGTDGDEVNITADSSAVLTNIASSDTLVTEYKISFDHESAGPYTYGIPGEYGESWTDYSTFLSTPAIVTYVPDDNDVEVTLYLKASNNADEVADAGSYSATQILTISWPSP